MGITISFTSALFEDGTWEKIEVLSLYEQIGDTMRLLTNFLDLIGLGDIGGIDILFAAMAIVGSNKIIVVASDSYCCCLRQCLLLLATTRSCQRKFVNT